MPQPGVHCKAQNEVDTCYCCVKPRFPTRDRLPLAHRVTQAKLKECMKRLLGSGICRQCCILETSLRTPGFLANVSNRLLPSPYATHQPPSQGQLEYCLL